MRLLLPLLFVAAFAGNTNAQVRLPKLIGDSMVLQRDVPLKIWGWAEPGENVTVSINNKKNTATTAPDGKWMLTLPQMQAGGPHTMKVSGKNEIVLKDVWIGDVWLCSGQSNMVLPMERVKEKYPEEISGATNNRIRNFFIPTVSDASKLHDDIPQGKWKASSPRNVLEMGAAAYFFAKQIYAQHQVPIGIINSSVGGTPVEAWISEEGFANFPQELQTIAKLKDTSYVNGVARAVAEARRNAPPVKQQPDKGTSGPTPWYATSFVPEGWKTMFLPGYWADQGIRGLNGVVWFRKEIEVPEEMAKGPAKLFLGRIVDADQAYVNGVLVGNITYQYPPRRYEVPQGVLKPGKNIIVVRVTNTAGKGGFVPDKNYSLTAGALRIDLRGDWQYKVGQVFAPVRPDNNGVAPIVMQNQPTGLYNTMIAPLVNYCLKGMVWYQGEANTNRAAQYQYLLPALIRDWRAKWGQGDLPFLFVQLPGFMEEQYLPSESEWAVLRNGQLKTLSVPNTAMAVAIDLGEWNDIHPLNKKLVGERLALAAEKLAYGNNTVVYSGPTVKSVERNGNRIVITFEHTGTGLIAKGDKQLNYFSIAGKDKRYSWANATIEGDKVIVWSDDLAVPVSVRYAWADNPDGANLYNREGLPASPFEVTVD
ncbi:sialate O-acetylesterase [Sediminibacterium roseum]|uniref:Sialate O-acetylesterase n=1 Tax=Sediminibacterium roseum TaxID=1978412 RepID=A0ABW9ZV60_9BACT|nr:sialate O-acetylesterase [Sediminibacterium roseum]NCI50119.1 sialate O-acetylesterase [Sediminibacterium roseum]